MSDELLPVVMRFSNIAPNSNINFTITTSGVAWSLGARSGDSMGLTMNAEYESNQWRSSIQHLEFAEGMLALRTANDGGSNSSFVVTMFVRVTPGVDYLQGYCTLNNEASVLVYFGAQRAVEWRNGRISAVLRSIENKFRSVLITAQGASPGDRIALQVTTKTGLGAVQWSLGESYAESEGILLTGANAPLPLTSFFYTGSNIMFDIARENAGNQSLDFLMLAYVTWEPIDLPYIYLKATCDRNVSMYAHVGNRQPQLVSQTYTVFTL